MGGDGRKRVRYNTKAFLEKEIAIDLESLFLAPSFMDIRQDKSTSTVKATDNTFFLPVTDIVTKVGGNEGTLAASQQPCPATPCWCSIQNQSDPAKDTWLPYVDLA